MEGKYFHRYISFAGREIILVDCANENLERLGNGRGLVNCGAVLLVR